MQTFDILNDYMLTIEYLVVDCFFPRFNMAFDFKFTYNYINKVDQLRILFSM